MKKKLAFILAIALILALFVGCGETGTTTTTETAEPTAAASSEPTPEPTPEPTEENSPYNFAIGQYEKNEKGYPTAPYEYELPLTTTDEVLSFWTYTYSPQRIPEEGYGFMPQALQREELTGVNIEYVLAPTETLKEQYGILLAADDLCDITCGAVALSSDTPEKNLEDGWWVNLYDYMDYCPNYIYQATFDPADDALFYGVFYRPDMIPCIYAIQDEAFIASNYTARGDWLDELGLDNENIITWDDVHEMLTLFKLNYCAFPFPLLTRIDMAGNYAFTSFDTLPYVSESVGPMYVVDGKVTFSNMNDNDKELATLLNQWFEEGLIDPNWASYANNQSFVDKTVGNEVGYVYMSPGEVDGYERGNTNDPDARWDPIHKPLKTPDQVVHVGGEKARLWYGSAVISPKCENIELAVTWIDWRYSPSGSFAVSYGPEGVLWETDENGNMVATDEALNPEDGLAFAWACNLYGLNPLAEPGLAISARKYIVPGGDRMLAIHYFWDDYNYDGAYEWPTGIKLTQEQTEEVNQYAADLGTFVTENYSGFIDGSKPLSEWDSYVAELKNLGIETVIAIYQKAYDDYMEFLASF